MQQIILNGYTLEQLAEALTPIIQCIIEQAPQNQEAIILSREQACAFLQIDSSTLWRWTEKGIVKAYGAKGRRYYKKDELLECLKPLKK